MLKENKLYFFVIIVVFVVGNFLPLNAQKLSDVERKQILNSFGKEFWLCFQRNYKEPTIKADPNASDLILELFITSDDTANVRIEIKGLDTLIKIVVPAKSVETVRIPPQAQVKSEEVIEDLGIYIRADKPISVYGLNRRYQTTDTYLALPVEVLGTEYRVMCYTVSDNLMPQFAIVATESNTEVTITPTVNTVKNPANKPFKVFLNKGQVYQVVAKNEPLSKCDLTGTKIVSNKKIAVFSGHQCAYVPPKVIACNHLVEQMPPIPAWGKHFYLGRLKARSNYTYRVLANEPKTRVFKDGAYFKELNAGEYFEDIEKKEIQISADKPILVAQYSQGFKNGDSIGDPMMILVSPTQQFLKSYRFATPVKGDWEHYVNIIVPNEGISGILLNGRPVDKSLFKQLGITSYSIAYINVPYGSHSLIGTHPFGMYSYGFGKGDDSYDAYGTMGGQSFMEYIPIKDSLPPYFEFKTSDAKDTIYVIIKDDRIDDTGLREVLTTPENLKVLPYKLEAGTLQKMITVVPEQREINGRLVIEAVDVAQNKSFGTICYFLNPLTDKYEFTFSDGIVKDCSPLPGYQIGLFGNISAVFHSADFHSTDGYFSKGTFSDGFGFGGYGGIYIARRFSQSSSISLRIIYENYAGMLEAPDSSVSHIRDSNGELIPFQETSLITLNSRFLKFALTYEHYYGKFFYGLAGLNISLPLSKSFTAKKKILQPLDYSYSLDGVKEKIDENAPSELSSLSSINYGAIIGAGASYPIIKKVNAFAELNFYFPFSNIINDGNWKIYQLNLILGAKIKL